MQQPSSWGNGSPGGLGSSLGAWGSDATELDLGVVDQHCPERALQLLSSPALRAKRRPVAASAPAAEPGEEDDDGGEEEDPARYGNTWWGDDDDDDTGELGRVRPPSRPADEDMGWSASSAALTRALPR